MARRLRSEAGSIYVEALVAMAILSIALIPIFGAFVITPAAQQQAGRRMEALNVARGELERLHSLPGDEWEQLTTATLATPGGFTLYREVSPPEQGLRQIQVRVTWQSPKGGEQQVTLATAIARRL